MKRRSAVPCSARPAARSAADPNGATVGYEADLWRMADALRGSLDAAEYKHVGLSLLFLKSMSDWRRRCAGSSPNCAQQAEAAGLDAAIWKNLKELGYVP